MVFTFRRRCKWWASAFLVGRCRKTSKIERSEWIELWETYCRSDSMRQKVQFKIAYQLFSFLVCWAWFGGSGIASVSEVGSTYNAVDGISDIIVIVWQSLDAVLSSFSLLCLLLGLLRNMEVNGNFVVGDVLIGDPDDPISDKRRRNGAKTDFSYFSCKSTLASSESVSSLMVCMLLSRK